MAANLEIRLLGGLQIEQQGLAVAGFMSSKVPALLAYLAVTGRPHQRDALAGLLWGEMPDHAAANNLRQALTNLRKLAEPHLVITRETVAFNPDAPYFLDVEGFKDFLRLSSGQPIAQRIGLLRQALAIYQGDFLEGFYVRDAPDFEDWALVQRVQLRELALHGWDKLTELLLNIGDYPGAVDAAGRLLAMDPWREEAHRQRMLALARSGQRSAALAQYQTCRTILQKEFDTEPSAETNALYERIRTAMRGTRHNLPAMTTGFVGRESELAELLRLLASPTSRLVTLLGPGGVGKTRLALEAAAAAEPAFLNGVWLVQLAGVDNPAALPWSLADAVGLPLAGAEPPEAQLLNFLRHRELLLVLDNFEPLIGKAALELVWRILQQAPAVKLLITSRERLNLAAEWLVDLAGLAFPTGNRHVNAQGYPAVELFVRRSHRVRPDFVLDAGAGEAVARICQLTEGLPLAIELAAAWMRTLPPAQIAEELAHGLALLASTAHDIPERHRSMAAVFEHSWTLLDSEAQTALAQLSVFRAGFDQAAAQVVANAGLPLLQTLVDRSLLRMDDTGRFEMHPLVRQFAGDRLSQSPQATAARSRHAKHFAGLTGRREHEFHGEQDRLALQWMLREADNIRLAWDWGVRQADAALLEPFIESFLYFFDIQGRYRDCLDLIRDAVHALQSMNRQPGASLGLGRVIALRAAFRFRLGEFESAREDAEKALALLESHRPHRDVGHARLYLGAAWYGQGDLSRAVQWSLAAVAAYQEAGHAWGIGAALDNAGYVEFLRGNDAEAETHLKRSLDVARRTGSRYLLTGVYDHLAVLTAGQGRFVEAMAFVEQCRQILDEMDRPYIVASLSLSLSQIAMQAGDLDSAENHIGRALRVARDTGNQFDLVHFLLQLGAVTVARGDYAAALAAYQEAAAVGQEIHAESLMVDVVAGLADRAWVMSRRTIATTLFRFVQSHPSASQETISRAAGRLDDPTLRPLTSMGPLNIDEALALGLRSDRYSQLEGV